MDLERELRALPIEWPPTPQLRPVLARRRRRRGRWSRRSRWLPSPLPSRCHSRAARSCASSTSAPTRSSSSTRCRPRNSGRSTRGSARRRPLLNAHRLRADAPAAAARLAARPPCGRQCRLDGLPPPRPPRASERGRRQRLVSQETRRRPDQRLTLGESPRRYGLWLSGKPHIFFFPREPARLAGNTLVWQENSTTYRLEGPGLAKREALDLARSLRDTP